MTVELYANEIGLTVEEVLDLCEKLGILVDDKDSLLSTESINILNNNILSPYVDNSQPISNTDNSPTVSPKYEPDFNFELEDLYLGNVAIKNIVDKFKNLAYVLNSVDIGGCELSTAPNLATAKSNISSLLSDSVTEIGSRVEAVKNKVEEKEPLAAALYEQLDRMYNYESNEEFANFLGMELGATIAINSELFDDKDEPFDEATSVANTEFWNNFQSFLNSDGSINEDKINEYLQVHPEVNCAENCINFYQSVFNGVTEQYESLKANQEFINEWERGNFVDELGNLNYDLINKYKENNSHTTFIDSIVSNYQLYINQAGQLDLNDINSTSTGKFGQLDLANLSKLSILDNVYGEMPISEGSIYIGDNITKSDILFNIERAYAEAAIDVYSSMISINGINSEICKGLIDSQKILVDATINYLQEKQKILDDQFEDGIRPILNYEDTLSEIWDYPNAQEYYNILELMRNNEISIVQLNGYFKENENYEIFSSSGDLITFTREDFKGFVQILDKHVQEETGNTYSQIITKQNEIVTLISTLKSSKYRIRQIEKELPYMEIAESDEYSEYLKNIQDEHSIKLDFRANGEDTEYIYIIDGKEVEDINPLMIAKLIEDGKLDKFYGIDFQYSDAYNNYKYLTDNNKNMYNYLYETKGLQVAEEYIKAIEDSINQKKGLADAEKFLNDLRDGNGNIELSFSNYLKSGAEGVFDGAKSFFNGLGNIGNSEAMMNSEAYKQMYMLQELSSIDKSWIDNFYELGISFGNMLPSMALGATISILCPPATAVTLWGHTFNLAAGSGSLAMGASVFGNSKNQALIDGNDLLTSTVYGALSGVSETVLGYFLGNMPGMSQIAKFTVGDIFKEGVEEFIQEYVDAGLRAVLLNETIDAEQLMGDAGKSFLYGMIMSAGTTGATTVGKAVCNISINGETVKINDTKSLFNFFSLFNGDKVAIQKTSDGKKVFVLSPEANIDSDLAKINNLFPNATILQQTSDGSLILLSTVQTLSDGTTSVEDAGTQAQEIITPVEEVAAQAQETITSVEEETIEEIVEESILGLTPDLLQKDLEDNDLIFIQSMLPKDIYKDIYRLPDQSINITTESNNIILDSKKVTKLCEVLNYYKLSNIPINFSKVMQYIELYDYKIYSYDLENSVINLEHDTSPKKLVELFESNYQFMTDLQQKFPEIFKLIKIYADEPAYIYGNHVHMGTPGNYEVMNRIVRGNFLSADGKNVQFKDRIMSVEEFEKNSLKGKKNIYEFIDENIDIYTQLITFISEYTKLQEDTVIIRGTNIRTLRSLLGLNLDDNSYRLPNNLYDVDCEEMLAQILNNGGRYVDNSILSSSPIANSFITTSKPIYLEMYCEKGIPALYGDIVGVTSEKEVLIPGSLVNMEVFDVRVEEINGQEKLIISIKVSNKNQDVSNISDIIQTDANPKNVDTTDNIIVDINEELDNSILDLKFNYIYNQISTNLYNVYQQSLSYDTLYSELSKLNSIKNDVFKVKLLEKLIQNNMDIRKSIMLHAKSEIQQYLGTEFMLTDEEINEYFNMLFGADFVNKGYDSDITLSWFDFKESIQEKVSSRIINEYQYKEPVFWSKISKEGQLIMDKKYTTIANATLIDYVLSFDLAFPNWNFSSSSYELKQFWNLMSYLYAEEISKLPIKSVKFLYPSSIVDVKSMFGEMFISCEFPYILESETIDTILLTSVNDENINEESQISIDISDIKQYYIENEDDPSASDYCFEMFLEKISEKFI